MAFARNAQPVGRSALTAVAIAAAAMLVANSAAAATTPLIVDHGLVLDHITIVDTHDGTRRRDMAVVIDGTRIVEVRAAGGVVVRGTARSIDGRGKFVVPGFLDMHAHPLTTGSTPADLHLMLSLGVTGFRQMNGSPELLARRKAGTLMPAGAPTLLALPGNILAGPLGATPEAATAEIQRQKAQGADFIKVIDLPPPAFFAALAEAKANGLRVAGHLPPAIDVRRAAAEGMHAIEHLGPREAILLAVRRRKPHFAPISRRHRRGRWRRRRARPVPPRRSLPAPAVRRPGWPHARWQTRLPSRRRLPSSDMARCSTAMTPAAAASLPRRWSPPTCGRCRR